MVVDVGLFFFFAVKKYVLEAFENEGVLYVKYFQLFKKKGLSIPISESELTFYEYRSFRGGKMFDLYIKHPKQKVFKIESSLGIKQEQLKKFYDYIKSKK
jgi:hypothetical protein